MLSRLGMAMQETWSYSTWFGKCSIHSAYSVSYFMIFSDLTLLYLLMYLSYLSILLRCGSGLQLMAHFLWQSRIILNVWKQHVF